MDLYNKKFNIKKVSINFSFYMIWIINILISLLTFLDEMELRTIVFYCSYIFIIFGFLNVLLVKRKDSISKKKIWILLLILIFSFLSILVSKTMLNLETLKVYYIFLATLLFFYTCSEIEISKLMVSFVLTINLFLSFLYILVFLFQKKIFFFEGILTFNWGNPNTTGHWIFLEMIYLILFYYYTNKKSLKFILGLCSIILFYFLYLTDARMSIVSILVCMFFALIENKMKNIKLSNVFVTICILAPLIIPICLVLIYKFNVLENFTFLGKSIFSGREVIWSVLFENSKKHLLLGNYSKIISEVNVGISKIITRDAYLSLHNSYMEVIGRYGYITFFLFLEYLFTIVITINDNCTSKTQKIALLAFLIALISDTTESTLVSGVGTVTLYISIGTLIILARYKIDRRNT